MPQQQVFVQPNATVMELSYIIQEVGTNDYDEQDQSTCWSNASDSSSKTLLGDVMWYAKMLGGEHSSASLVI